DGIVTAAGAVEPEPGSGGGVDDRVAELVPVGAHGRRLRSGDEEHAATVVGAACLRVRGVEELAVELERICVPRRAAPSYRGPDADRLGGQGGGAELAPPHLGDDRRDPL